MTNLVDKNLMLTYRFGMLCHPGWVVCSYSGSPLADRTVETKSTRGFNEIGHPALYLLTVKFPSNFPPSADLLIHSPSASVRINGREAARAEHPPPLAHVVAVVAVAFPASGPPFLPSGLS